MIRKWRMTAWALAVTLAMSSLALADRDDDRDRDRDRNNKKYERERKKEEKREREREKERERYRGRNDMYYENGHWWHRGDGDHDRDDRRLYPTYGYYPNRGGYYGNGGYGNGIGFARQWGYQDGAAVARADMDHRHGFDPYPRGKYGHRDRGYRSEYGSKGAYQDEYARAYQEGYQSIYRGYRY